MLNELHLTMSLDAPLTADERKELHDLLCDALAEFRCARTPAREYVDTRYPDVEGYRWLNRDKKVIEVSKRCMLAERLRNAVAGSLRVDGED